MDKDIWFAGLLCLLLGPLAALAQSTAWVMSIPHARSGEHIYKIKILSIDGVKQPEVFRYPLESGSRRVQVQLMLDVEWEPDLREGRREAEIKTIEIQAQEGVSYLLAARVNVDAPAEAQLDGSYWEVFVYEESD